jgi:hypothetical protein
MGGMMDSAEILEQHCAERALVGSPLLARKDRQPADFDLQGWQPPKDARPQ